MKQNLLCLNLHTNFLHFMVLVCLTVVQHGFIGNLEQLKGQNESGGTKKSEGGEKKKNLLFPHLSLEVNYINYWKTSEGPRSLD